MHADIAHYYISNDIFVFAVSLKLTKILPIEMLSFLRRPVLGIYFLAFSVYILVFQFKTHIFIIVCDSRRMQFEIEKCIIF